jgi:GNAT superfamily N-acetyltransferase
MTNPEWEIGRLRADEQQAARELILAGLAERWGHLDPDKNPDLDDLLGTYGEGLFLVARCGGQVIGTGAFRPHDAETVEIVRMSVHRHWRRRGIGRAILAALCREARQRGYRRAVLETTRTWHDAIAFYCACGFQPTHIASDDQYFLLDLDALLYEKRIKPQA